MAVYIRVYFFYIYISAWVLSFFLSHDLSLSLCLSLRNPLIFFSPFMPQIFILFLSYWYTFWCWCLLSLQVSFCYWLTSNPCRFCPVWQPVETRPAPPKKNARFISRPLRSNCSVEMWNSLRNKLPQSLSQNSIRKSCQFLNKVSNFVWEEAEKCFKIYHCIYLFGHLLLFLFTQRQTLVYVFIHTISSLSTRYLFIWYKKNIFLSQRCQNYYF